MSEQTEPKRRGRPPKAEILSLPVVNDPREAAQAYALRVWSGQSTDLPRNERMRRVALALEGQGMSMDGVSL